MKKSARVSLTTKLSKRTLDTDTLKIRIISSKCLI